MKAKDTSSIAFKLYSVMEIVIDGITNEDWHGNALSELDYQTQWRSIMKKPLQDIGIHLRSGEPSCSASKFERQISENEYGGVKKSILGRKIDLLPTFTLKEHKRSDISVELEAIEVKPEAVEESVEMMQLNKSIREALISIQHSLLYPFQNNWFLDWLT